MKSGSSLVWNVSQRNLSKTSSKEKRARRRRTKAQHSPPSSHQNSKGFFNPPLCVTSRRSDTIARKMNGKLSKTQPRLRSRCLPIGLSWGGEKVGKPWVDTIGRVSFRQLHQTHVHGLQIAQPRHVFHLHQRRGRASCLNCVCTTIGTGEHQRRMTESIQAEVLEQLTLLADQGLRVMAIVGKGTDRKSVV